jgi:hypothetical protein
VSSHGQDAHLGYLLKHAQLRFFELGAVALAPLGINGREAAVLRAIDAGRPVSQGEIARAMSVDRTTMVALIDDLQLKGLVQRRQDPDDRRRNVVERTPVAAPSGRPPRRSGRPSGISSPRSRPPRPRSSSRRCAHC